MPRKPKAKKTKITVVVHGNPVAVTLFPPSGGRKSWYAYWTGLVASKSTCEKELKAAVAAAEDMIRNGGKRSQLAETILSDQEFEEIQRRHFGKKKGEDAEKRAQKSLVSCLEAIGAFREIAGVSPVALASPADCERFQHEALRLSKNWRSEYPNNKAGAPALSPNTVIKWSVALQAAFERTNSNGGKKCVRGVVDGKKLLTSNAWKHFTWIAGTTPKKRQFDDEELLSIIDYFESKWPAVMTASLFAKTSLWIWARRSEVAGLRWENLRTIENEFHLDFVGKWGVRKWARIPERLHQELLGNRSAKSSYVFAAYNDQLRSHHENGPRPGAAKAVGQEFDPEALYRWFHHRIRRWSEVAGRERASHHAFRKTALQLARRGEDRNENVAQDARVSRSVMMQHYVEETEEELRQASNRTYRRLLAGLNPQVAARYSYDAGPEAPELERRLHAAVNAKNWALVRDVAAGLLARSSD